MATDFSPYVNLVPYNANPRDVYLNSIEVAQMNLPGFAVRPGTLEDAMLQSMSYLSTLAVNHINALPNRLMEGVLSLMGFRRETGQYATVSATITAMTYAGGTIPANTIFSHVFTSGSESVVTYYTLLESASMDAVEQDPNADPPTPLPTVEVVLYARDVGEVPAVQDGDELECLNVVPDFGGAVAIEDPFSQGSDGEDDVTYLARGATYLESLTTSIVTARQVEAYIASSFPVVRRVRGYDTTDSDSDDSVGAPDAPGYMSVYVYADGRPLTVAEKSEIYLTMTDRTSPGLYIGLYDPNIVSFECELTIGVHRGFDAGSVTSAVRSALTTYFSPNLFPYTETKVRKNTVLALASGVSGVAFVSDVVLASTDMAVDGDDYALQTKGALPSLDSADLTINVEIVQL